MASPEKVFVVHGRNMDARDAMFAFLRSVGLRPIEWDQAVTLTGKGSPYIGDVLDAAFTEGQAVVVLLTPDDVTYLRPEYASGESDPDSQPSGQARPNVLFEAGMAMGRDPDRTILVELGRLRPFSDVGGRHVIHLADSPAARKSLTSRLQTAGCAVDLSGSDWLRAGDFSAPAPPGGGLPLGKRLPSSARRGASLDGRWITSGGSQVDQIKLTNNGAVPILNLQLIVPEELAEHIQLYNEDQIAKLPVGKTATLRGWTTNSTYQGGAPHQFELRAVGRLEDGTSFEQDIFFDAG